MKSPPMTPAAIKGVLPIRRKKNKYREETEEEER
jgi:hypothetical protein